MKVLEVLPCEKVLIEFQDWKKYQKEIYWQNFKNGNVKNPYDKVRYGVGYIGDGEYQVESVLGTHDKSYDVWQNMLERCYSKKLRYKHPAYVGCIVCNEWHNYQNFAKWYKENEYITDGRLHLDKDILIRGNKIYSPEFCLLVPQRINMLFVARPNQSDLPTGIRKAANGKFRAMYNTINLGIFKTLQEAVNAYNIAKAKVIKQVADEYKDVIPDKLYEALLKW